jgi:hypothetical protein
MDIEFLGAIYLIGFYLIPATFSKKGVKDGRYKTGFRIKPKPTILGWILWLIWAVGVPLISTSAGFIDV